MAIKIYRMPQAFKIDFGTYTNESAYFKTTISVAGDIVSLVNDVDPSIIDVEIDWNDVTVPVTASAAILADTLQGWINEGLTDGAVRSGYIIEIKESPEQIPCVDRLQNIGGDLYWNCNPIAGAVQACIETGVESGAITVWDDVAQCYQKTDVFLGSENSGSLNSLTEAFTTPSSAAIIASGASTINNQSIVASGANNTAIIASNLAVIQNNLKSSIIASEFCTILSVADTDAYANVIIASEDSTITPNANTDNYNVVIASDVITINQGSARSFVAASSTSNTGYCDGSSIISSTNVGGDCARTSSIASSSVTYAGMTSNTAFIGCVDGATMGTNANNVATASTTTSFVDSSQYCLDAASVQNTYNGENSAGIASTVAMFDADTQYCSSLASATMLSTGSLRSASIATSNVTLDGCNNTAVLGINNVSLVDETDLTVVNQQRWFGGHQYKVSEYGVPTAFSSVTIRSEHVILATADNFTFTLPGNFDPCVDGTTLIFKCAVIPTVGVVINGNGENIDGAATTTLQSLTNLLSITIVYSSSQGAWFII